ncbi:GNAT family N-acetyltransferase [Leuconostoc holzapfelii]|uniref:GNAT family N-acetyltransferase n=1 Tax=Leuconostoc holzapfelii TaxID=434464 RepID=A0A846ZBB2_9LACO|nr:GNAT family N-acetyltransferase [Leuconostoc holzapfelii]NKZ18716.1 GNAT family N-acetyltransferase [Leuconostoc holzapfelii]
MNDALENSEKTYTRLLPNGLETSGNYFYSIYDEINIIGYIWLGTDSENESNAFIFDFEIYKQYQNNGFGSKAIILAEKEAKNMGFRTIGLHVFGSNQRAIHVYQKCGYGITDIKMQKAL